jgi:DNA-binding NarL/FixJ family response regulator
MPLRVYACVRESVFLKGLESIFPASGVVLCGGSIDEAEMFDAIPAARPDVLIYEPGFEESLDYLSLLRRNYPRIPVLMLYEPGFEEELVIAISRGAAACAPKTLSRESLMDWLERIAPEPFDTPEPDAAAGAGQTLPRRYGSEAIERKRISALLSDLERFTGASLAEN